MTEKIKDATLEKLSERLEEENLLSLAPSDNNSKLNCWSCGKYSCEAEACYTCNQCNLWTLKKIFLHNRRYLRYLEDDKIHVMGLTA